ncbi:arginase [Emticicia aquatilis]|uniref:Arginase n=1 Tax=Emticicia aquatilis TaxID=1537369 RepID=A0A916YPK9_9BACT|nr:formimidoylglutamase [Emticicia aquatilis]GGD54615.1 arginase [Emticicia aquatilis]
MPNLKTYQQNDLNSIIKTRMGETKLGEKINLNWQADEVKFVLLGIAEDIGVQVNRGIGGTHTAWESFLNAFLNIQSTKMLSGTEIGIYGCLSFDDLKVNSKSVEIIDNEVVKAISEIVNLGKTLIIIGGGHNNAYPIIKGVSMAKKRAINAINLDAHSDFRIQEGRHSGNGFRYAFVEEFLQKYAIIGLHENYNSQAIINEISQNPAIQFSFWEDIFLREKMTFKEAILQAVDFTKNTPTGIELDLDCVENVLSSAMTPCGISPTQTRQYIYQTATLTDIAYLHICEGATQLATGQASTLTGKLISYLVSDFMKAFNHKGTDYTD